MALINGVLLPFSEKVNNGRRGGEPYAPIEFMEAVLHFNQYELPSWRGKLNALELYIDKVSVPIVKATGQIASKCHTVLDNTSGQAALKLLVMRGEITFWNVNSGATIATFKDIPSSKEITEMLDNVDAGKDKCDMCGHWFQTKDMKSFSFAGIVCKKCYNPRKHLPPDTRGD